MPKAYKPVEEKNRAQFVFWRGQLNQDFTTHARRVVDRWMDREKLPSAEKSQLRQAIRAGEIQTVKGAGRTVMQELCTYTGLEWRERYAQPNEKIKAAMNFLKHHGYSVSKAR